MKTKRFFLAVAITALVITVILISLRAYYVAIALVAGTLIMGYRELWSLVRRREMPVIDERVRENVGKSVRNGFIFLVMALAFLMLPFSTVLIGSGSSMVHVLGGLFVSAALAYLLSYLFYDRVRPGLGEKGLKIFCISLLTAGISLAVFVISVVLHNGLSGLLGVEEPVFFVIAVIVSPAGMAVGIVGSLAIFTKGLFNKAP